VLDEKQKKELEEEMHRKKARTVPCRYYHSQYGCGQGDTCNFMHDSRYEGKAVPNIDLRTKPIESMSLKPE
jgi:hypothetical protein